MKELRQIEESKLRQNSSRCERIKSYMGSDTLKSAIYNVKDNNKVSFDKITTCSDNNVLKSFRDYEPKNTIIRSKVAFDNKRGFFS